MQIGVIGLGRMGANIVRRLERGKHECVAYDADASVVARLAAEGLPVLAWRPFCSDSPAAGGLGHGAGARRPRRPFPSSANCCSATT